MKTYPLADVLSITTGRLLCDIGRVYEILNHITGDNLFTHVLPRASEFARPLLYKLYPELGTAEACLDKLTRWLKADKTEKKTEFFKMWKAELQMIDPRIKDEYEIPTAAEQWTVKDPTAELVELRESKEGIITIQAP